MHEEAKCLDEWGLAGEGPGQGIYKLPTSKTQKLLGFGPLFFWEVHKIIYKNKNKRRIKMFDLVALIHLAGPWSVARVLDPSRGPCFVLWGPCSCCGVLIRPNWDPYSSCRALIHPAGLWFILRGPDPPRGALIRLMGPWFVQRNPDLYSGPWFVPRNPDPSRVPWFVLQGPDSSCKSRFVLGGLIRPVGPDLTSGDLICPARYWIVLHVSRRALIRFAVRWSVLRDTDPFRRAPIRLAGPWSVPRGPKT